MYRIPCSIVPSHLHAAAWRLAPPRVKHTRRQSRQRCIAFLVQLFLCSFPLPGAWLCRVYRIRVGSVDNDGTQRIKNNREQTACSLRFVLFN